MPYNPDRCRKLCGSLIAPLQPRQQTAHASVSADEELSQENKPSIINGRTTIASSLGAAEESHMIVENLPQKTRLYQPQKLLNQSGEANAESDI